MNPLAVVEPLDIVEDALPCLVTGAISLVEDPLSFQSAEEALHRRIVPAVALATHAAQHPVLCQELLVVITGILGATIGVMKHSPRRVSPLQGHARCIAYQGRREPLRHGPADNTTRVQVHDDCQVQPPLGAPGIGNVRSSNPV